MSDDSLRGTGRTKRMVQHLPASGCAVVVHNADGLRYVRQMIADLRGAEFLKTVRLCTLENVDNLRGVALPIYVDHYVREFASNSVFLRIKFDLLCDLRIQERKAMITKEAVFSNLDNAKTSGYFEEGEHLHGCSAKEIANDLIAYADDCYESTVEELEPLVAEWLATNPPAGLNGSA